MQLVVGKWRRRGAQSYLPLSRQELYLVSKDRPTRTRPTRRATASSISGLCQPAHPIKKRSETPKEDLGKRVPEPDRRARKRLGMLTTLIS